MSVNRTVDSTRLVGLDRRPPVRNAPISSSTRSESPANHSWSLPSSSPDAHWVSGPPRTWRGPRRQSGRRVDAEPASAPGCLQHRPHIGVLEQVADSLEVSAPAGQPFAAPIPASFRRILTPARRENLDCRTTPAVWPKVGQLVQRLLGNSERLIRRPQEVRRRDSTARAISLARDDSPPKALPEALIPPSRTAMRIRCQRRRALREARPSTPASPDVRRSAPHPSCPPPVGRSGSVDQTSRAVAGGRPPCSRPKSGRWETWVWVQTADRGPRCRRPGRRGGRRHLARRRFRGWPSCQDHDSQPA